LNEKAGSNSPSASVYPAIGSIAGFAPLLDSPSDAWSSDRGVDGCIRRIVCSAMQLSSRLDIFYSYYHFFAAGRCFCQTGDQRLAFDGPFCRAPRLS
jgi:hypothetical protein